MTEPDDHTAAALGEAIARADDGRATPPPPLPKGWAGLVEKDRRARARSHPNPAGGFLSILYPWRLHVAVLGALLVVLAIVTAALR